MGEKLENKKYLTKKFDKNVAEKWTNVRTWLSSVDNLWEAQKNHKGLNIKKLNLTIKWSLRLNRSYRVEFITSKSIDLKNIDLKNIKKIKILKIHKHKY